jgi:hypothetical protein
MNISSTEGETKLNSSNDIYSVMPLVVTTPLAYRHLLTAFLIISFLLCVHGNALVLEVHRRLRTRSSTDWMVFYLAICDLCSLGVCVPSFVLTNLGAWIHIMGSAFCSFHYMILTACAQSSSFLIATTAVIRYHKSTIDTERLTPKMAKILGFCVILFFFVSSSTAFVTHKNDPHGYCYYDPSTATLQTILYLFYLINALSCSVIVFTMYTKIALRIRMLREINPIASLSQQAKNSALTTKIMAAVAVVFFFVKYSNSCMLCYTYYIFQKHACQSN